MSEQSSRSRYEKVDQLMAVNWWKAALKGSMLFHPMGLVLLGANVAMRAALGENLNIFVEGREDTTDDEQNSSSDRKLSAKEKNDETLKFLAKQAIDHNYSIDTLDEFDQAINELGRLYEVVSIAKLLIEIYDPRRSEEENLNLQAFIEYIIYPRFKTNPEEFQWFRQRTTKQQVTYALRIWQAENKAGRMTYETFNGIVDINSPLYEQVRLSSFKKAGLHLWGFDFLAFVNADLNAFRELKD